MFVVRGGGPAEGRKLKRTSEAAASEAAPKIRTVVAEGEEPEVAACGAARQCAVGPSARTAAASRCDWRARAGEGWALA
jgi:hypothetical protein